MDPMTQEPVLEHDGGDQDDEAHEASPQGGSLFDFAEGAEGAEGDDAGAGQDAAKQAPPAGKQDQPDPVKLKQDNENLKRALVGERTKRQEYQREIEQLKLQINRMLQQLQPQPQPPPQPMADNDEEEDPLEPIVDPLLQRKIEPLSQELLRLKFQVSEQNARLRYPDYDQMIEKAMPLIQNNLEWWHKAVSRENDPAEFTYRIGKSIHGSQEQIEAAKEAGRREILEKLKQGMAPEGLSSVSGGRRAGMETGPTPEQAAKANLWQWDKVPRDVIERSLEE